MGCEVVGKVVTIPKVGESGTDGRRMISKTTSVTDRQERPVRLQSTWLFSYMSNGCIPKAVIVPDLA